MGSFFNAKNQTKEEEMEIVYKSLDEIMPYERNPRNNDKAVDKVANSIEEFGFNQPIVIDAAGVIVAGHTRYRAAKKLGIEKVPCLMKEDLSPYQISAYRIADNKVSELSEWDEDLLEQELAELEGIIDMSQFGFSLGLEEIEITTDDFETDKYTNKITIPQYQITGDEPDITELYDTSKTNKLIKEIQESNIHPAQKDFLIEAAKRHTKFNYRNIAEYYAHQNPEMQKLMEKSALVIIDYDDAIANGYTTLKGTLETIKEKDIINEG